MTLTNRNVNVKYRLRFFDDVISPTVLYGMETVPITMHLAARLDTLQRKMLRGIVGWPYHTDETWEEVGSKMKRRLSNALSKQPIVTWSDQLVFKRNSLYKRVCNNCTLPMTYLAFLWVPKATARANGHTPYRNVGRPLTRWTDLCE